MSTTRIGSMVVIVLVALFVGAAPTRAAEQVTLPRIRPLTTLRQHILFTFNGRPLLVCENEIESGTRNKGVCKALETLPKTVPFVGGLTKGDVNEFVTYDGMDYERYNADTTWSVAPVQGYVPGLTTTQFFQTGIDSRAANAVVSRVGTVSVNGISGTQYQMWSLDKDINKASGGQYVFDTAISPDGYPLFGIDSFRGALEGLGSGQFDMVNTLSDFGASITVSPPPANTVHAASIGLSMQPSSFRFFQ